MAVLWLCGMGSIFAIILGLKAKREIDASQGAIGGGGLAMGGIAFGIGGLVLAAVGWAMVVLAGPPLVDLGAARLASEANAQLTSALEQGQDAQEAYRRKHGEYAESGWALRDVGFTAEGLWLSVYTDEEGYCMQVGDRRFSEPIYMHIEDEAKAPSEGRCS